MAEAAAQGAEAAPALLDVMLRVNGTEHRLSLDPRTTLLDALREHLVALHEIDKDDAELFLTATDPELLLKQVTRLVGQSDKRKTAHVVPGEGKTPSLTPGDADRRAFVRHLTGRE